MDRVLIITVCAIIEIISVAIVVYQHVSVRIVTYRVVIIVWSIVDIQLAVCLSICIVLVVIVN